MYYRMGTCTDRGHLSESNFVHRTVQESNRIYYSWPSQKLNCGSAQRKRVTDELTKIKTIFSSIDLLHVEWIY